MQEEKLMQQIFASGKKKYKNTASKEGGILKKKVGLNANK